MKVKELQKLLKTLDPNAVIDVSSDEEGNSFGDIEDNVAEGILKATGEKVFSLYPISNELPEERYK